MTINSSHTPSGILVFTGWWLELKLDNGVKCANKHEDVADNQKITVPMRIQSHLTLTTYFKLTPTEKFQLINVCEFEV